MATNGQVESGCLFMSATSVVQNMSSKELPDEIEEAIKNASPEAMKKLLDFVFSDDEYENDAATLSNAKGSKLEDQPTNTGQNDEQVEGYAVPESVMRSWAGQCSCCSVCSDNPCGGVMCGGLCDSIDCDCEV